MVAVEVPLTTRRQGQRVDRLVIEGDSVAMTGPSVEIRFPVAWGRKLLRWVEGPARNIVCNANPRRFNLLGITKDGEALLLSYVGPDGTPSVERTSRDFVVLLDQNL